MEFRLRLLGFMDFLQNNNVRQFLQYDMWRGRMAQRLGCSPMARKTWVQSQVESYQRL